MPRPPKQERAPREASSDASLWDDLDAPSSPFADVTTPPLNPCPALPPFPHLEHRAPSTPLAVSDTTAASATLHQHLELELELFPTSPPQASSSFNFEAAAATDPWSQSDLKATQFLRDEWLISAGQKQPTDLVDHCRPTNPVDDHLSPPDLLPSQLRANAHHNKMAFPSTSAAPSLAQSDRHNPSITNRGRSSLLDQLDVICSSPSQCSSSPHPKQHTSIRRSAPTARQPLRSTNKPTANQTCTSTEKQSEHRAALDMLNMSSSPPSQTATHITLIHDMPPEMRDLYHRLAFGNSSSVVPITNVGTTVRGTRGKTWQTTWQDDDAADPDEHSHAAGVTSRLNRTVTGTTTTVTRTDAAFVSTTSARGRNASSSTTLARKGAKPSKNRSSSSSATSASRGRSRFFTSRASRGAWRGRARGRGR